MLTQIFVALLLLTLLALSACSSNTPSREQPTPEQPAATTTSEPTQLLETSEPIVIANAIEMIANGFSPKTLNIHVGDTVTFVNDDTADHWPASAMHPTHSVYPGSSITKCGTPEESIIFDACRGIKPQASYTFTFTEKGTWNYHNHLNPRMFGTIVVA